MDAAFSARDWLNGALMRLLSPLPLWLWPIIGGASALGFQPNNIWPLSLLAFALLILQLPLMSRGRVFWAGWLFGLGHFTIGLRWIAVAFTFQAAMSAWLGYGAVVALSLYLALFPAVATLTARWISGSFRPLPLIIAFAGSWIVAEYLRSQLFTGFVWNPLSVVAVDAAWVTSWIGTYGLSGLLILLPGAMAMLLYRQWKGALALSTPPLLALAIGLYVQAQPSLPPTDQPVSIIQPNIGQEEKYDAALGVQNYRKLARLTMEAANAEVGVNNASNASAPARLIFWPEAATRWSLEGGYPTYFYSDQPGGSAVGTRMALAALMRPGDLLLTGGDRLEFDEAGKLAGARNSVFALSSDADIIASYDKAHLVPYGEYLPMKNLLERIGLRRLVPGSIDFWPGPGPRNLALGSDFGTAAMQVCYEIIFSGEVIEPGTRPAFIFNPSNDAWFGTVGPPQFLAQTRLRAIEEGIPVIRSTPTGVSAIIDADGRIVQSLPQRVQGRIDGMMPALAPATPFSKGQNWLPIGLAVMLIGISLVAKRRARR